MKIKSKKILLLTYHCSFFSRKITPPPSITRSKIIKSLPTTSEKEQQNIQVEILLKILIKKDSHYLKKILTFPIL